MYVVTSIAGRFWNADRGIWVDRVESATVFYSYGDACRIAWKKIGGKVKKL